MSRSHLRLFKTSRASSMLGRPGYCLPLLSANDSYAPNPFSRAKFGSQGWNVVCSFGDSDLDASFKLLGRFMDGLNMGIHETLTTLPLENLVYVTGSITYGGWITDEWDRRCLLAVLNHFYSASIFGDTVSLCSAAGGNPGNCPHHEVLLSDDKYFCLHCQAHASLAHHAARSNSAVG